MFTDQKFYSTLKPIEKLICSLIKFECQYEMLELYEKLDAKVLFIFANSNLVDSIVGYRLMEQYGEKNILKDWVNAYRETDKRISSYLNELDKVAKLLNENNIPLIALKNSGIAKTIYPYPGLVPMGDLDTLVKRSDFINAHNILTENGYKITTPNKYHIADVNIGYRKGGSEYTTRLKNGQELWFELQWRSVEGRFLRPEQEPNGDVLIDRSIPIEGSAIRVLSPEDNLLQVCLHTAKHSYVRSPGFRLHLDVDRIVNGSKLDWNIFLNNVFKHKVKTPVFFSLIIPKQLFNTPIPEEVLNSIMPNYFKKIIISNWIKKVGIFNPDEKKFGRVGYIVWNLILCNDFFGLFKALFPNIKWMKDRYDFIHTYQLPYYYIKRIYSLAIKRMST